MSKTSRIFLLIGMALLLHTTVWAQANTEFQELQDDVKKVSQSGMQFLKIGVDVRSSAMAGIGLTHQGDAANIFMNPAGIGFVERASVFVGHTQWIADMSKQSVSAAYNLGAFGVVGVHAAIMQQP